MQGNLSKLGTPQASLESESECGTPAALQEFSSKFERWIN